jgi:hypothetical protein
VNRKWLILVILLLLVFFGWKYLTRDAATGAAAADDDLALIFDRPWFDRVPTDPEGPDYLHVFGLPGDMPMGIFLRASAYHVELEQFTYERAGKKVRVRFPQSDRKARFSYRLRECDDLPPFDLCLELSKNPWSGPTRYYSSREGSFDLAGLPAAARPLLSP